MKFKVKTWPATFAGRAGIAAALTVAGGLIYLLDSGEDPSPALIPITLALGAFIIALEEAIARWLHYAKLEVARIYLHEGRSHYWIRYDEIYALAVQGEEVVLDCEAKSWLVKRRTKVKFKPENVQAFVEALDPRLKAAGGERLAVLT